MSTKSGRFPPGHCAQILPLPARDRIAAKAAREQRFAAMEAMARQLAGVASGSGWYHDEAVAKECGRRH